MTNYMNTRRKISDTVTIGEKTFTVECDWQWVDDNEIIDVSVHLDQTHRVTFNNVEGDALRAMAMVFLTVESMLQQESVEAK
jgi:hypothetical protein